MAYQTKTLLAWKTQNDLITFLKKPSSLSVQGIRPLPNQAPDSLAKAGELYLEALQHLSAIPEGESPDLALQAQLTRIESKLDALAQALIKMLEAEGRDAL